MSCLSFWTVYGDTKESNQKDGPMLLLTPALTPRCPRLSRALKRGDTAPVKQRLQSYGDGGPGSEGGQGQLQVVENVAVVNAVLVGHWHNSGLLGGTKCARVG